MVCGVDGKEVEVTKENKAGMYMEFLSEEGYRPTKDKDGDVTFKHEGLTYVIIVDDKDDEFFRVILPNIWPIKEQNERAKIEAAALYATAKTKVAKVFPVRDNVWVTVELFCSPPDAFRPVFRRSLSAMRTAAKTFAEKVRE